MANEETNKISVEEKPLSVVAKDEDSKMDTFFDSYLYDDSAIHLYKKGILVGHIYNPTKEILSKLLEIGVPQHRFEEGE